MHESWVRGNRRAFAISAVAPAFLAATLGAAFLALAILGDLSAAPRFAMYVLAGLLLAGAVFFAGSALYLMNTPRIAYRDGRVLVYLQPKSPESISLDTVECFFLGREPVEIGSRPSRVSNIVVRLAEADRELRTRTLKTRFGGYRDGYIIVDGAWCEPITPELMKQINARLSEARRQRETELGAERGAEQQAQQKAAV